MIAEIGVFCSSNQRWYLEYNGSGVWDGRDKIHVVFGRSIVASSRVRTCHPLRAGL